LILWGRLYLKTPIVQCDMDGAHLAAGALGFAVGWLVRFINTEKVEVPSCPPCRCECACQLLQPLESNSSTPSIYSWLGALCCIGVLADNAVLACKVSFVRKVGEQELAISVKGKAKGQGVYNPVRGFQLTQG
jgi:hypothetical protein